jgi:hypothetical protein
MEVFYSKNTFELQSGLHHCHLWELISQDLLRTDCIPARFINCVSIVIKIEGKRSGYSVAQFEPFKEVVPIEGAITRIILQPYVERTSVLPNFYGKRPGRKDLERVMRLVN